MSKLNNLNILNKDIKGIINKYLLPCKEKLLDLKELNNNIHFIYIDLDLYIDLGLYYLYKIKLDNIKYKRIKNEWVLDDKN